MSNIYFPVGLGLVLALGANPSVWTARLEGKDGSKISGTARVETVAPMTPPADSTKPPANESGSQELRVTVTVSGAPQNSSLSFDLRSGKCSMPGAVIGTPASYGTIKADDKGNGNATAQIKGPAPTGEFHVSVYSAGQKPAACGDLEQSKTSTEG